MCANGCDKPPYRRGLCTACVYAERKANNPPCTVDGCDKPVNARGLCMMHTQRLNRYGTLDRIGGTDLDQRRTDDALIGYRAMHLRVERARGKARDHACAGCGGPAAEWSYNGSGEQRVDFVRGYVLPFSTDVEAFEPLCRPCHRQRDYGPGSPWHIWKATG